MKLDIAGRPAYAYTGGKPFDPALPCVAFIHGALNDHSVWTLAARWFAHHGHAVLALDLPGHGRSAGPALASVEALANWALAATDAAGVAAGVPLALVGHSMGSLVALEAAARAPQRVTALVLVATAYPMAVSAALLETAAREPLRAIDMVNALSLSTMAAKPSFPGPGIWLHGSNRALMRRILASSANANADASPGAPNLFHHDFSLCDAYRNGLQAAAAVACPATVVVGAADQMTPPHASREIAAALKARTVTLRAGHQLMAEAPAELQRALQTALQTGPQPG